MSTATSSRYLRPAAILLFIALAITARTYAAAFAKGESVHISNMHTINGDLYAFASSVAIDGIVDGDLCAGASEVSIAGEVTGSANVAAYEFRHTGNSGGSIRAAAFMCIINGSVGRSVVAAANEIKIGNRATVRKDIRATGNRVRIDGNVMGNVDVQAGTVGIGGRIDGDVTLRAEKISIYPPAVIRGNLTYISEHELEIDTAGGVTIVGEIDWQQPKLEEDKEPGGKAFTSAVLTISKLLATFLFGIILISLFRNYAHEPFNQMRSRFAVSTAAGFLTLFACLLCALVLIASIIAMAVSLTVAGSDATACLASPILVLKALILIVVLVVAILLIVISAFTLTTCAVLFYSGKILVALLIGYLIVKLAKRDAAPLSKTQLLIGLVILTALFAIPYLGFLLYLLVSVIGMGGIAVGLRRHCRQIQQHHAHARETNH